MNGHVVKVVTALVVWRALARCGATKLDNADRPRVPYHFSGRVLSMYQSNMWPPVTCPPSQITTCRPKTICPTTCKTTYRAMCPTTYPSSTTCRRKTTCSTTCPPSTMIYRPKTTCSTTCPPSTMTCRSKTTCPTTCSPPMMTYRPKTTCPTKRLPPTMTCRPKTTCPTTCPTPTTTCKLKTTCSTTCKTTYRTTCPTMYPSPTTTYRPKTTCSTPCSTVRKTMCPDEDSWDTCCNIDNECNTDICEQRKIAAPVQVQQSEARLGTAAAAKAVCDYLDLLIGHPQRTYMKSHFSMNMTFLGEYPDAAAFLLIIFVALIVAWGVRKSSNVNSMFTVFNLLTVSTIVVSGIYFADFSNWSIPKSRIPIGVNGGNGGFFPFGWTGVIVGAARCFYAYVGFDSMATTGDETKNPTRTIPIAIILTLFLATLAYCSVASVLTLMWPYYDQDPNAPLPVIYEHLGMPVIKYLVSCGTVSALVATLIGCMFPVPRILYSMSSDGLLFNFLSKVNENTKTPFAATLVCGLGSGILSSIFNLDQLIDMMSIGTLLTYVIISVCILILRYKDNNNVNDERLTGKSLMCTFFNLSTTKMTNRNTQYVSRVLLFIFTVTAIAFCFCFVNIDCYESAYRYPLTVIIVISLGILLATMLMLHKLPQAIETLSFRVPAVPFLPCLSIVLNLYMMMELNYKTWIRFVLGVIIGLLIYVFYGIRYSIEGVKQRAIKNEKIRNKL